MTKPGHIRLTAAREQYLQGSPRLADRTISSYRFTIGAFIRYTGDVYVENLRPRHVEAFLAHLSGPHEDGHGKPRDGLSGVSMNGYISRLKPFFAWLGNRAMTKGHLMVEVKRFRAGRPLKLRLDSSQLWDLLDAAGEGRDRALIAVAIHTALRASEIQSLRVGDLDLDRRTLRVTIHKSAQEDLMIVGDDLAHELTVWRTEYAQRVGTQFGRMLRPTDHLLPGLSTGHFTADWEVRNGRRERCRTPSGINPAKPVAKPHEVVQAALQVLGLPTRGEGVHTIRRSAARLLFDTLVNQRGHDGALRVVSSMLHHASSATTEIYLGFSVEHAVRDHHLRQHGILGPRVTTVARVIELAT